MVTKYPSAGAEKGKALGMPPTLACLFAAVMMAACMAPPYSEAPLATNFPRQAQQKPQSAGHWSIVANDLVDHIRPAITGNSIFIKKPSVETEFSRVFRAQVISALSNKGIRVNKEAYANVLTLDIDAQLVHFSPGRHQNTYVPVSVLLATGYWVLRGLDLNSGALQVVGTEAGAAAIDWNSWFNSQYASGPTPEHELIVTISVSNSTQILGQRTDVYYITDSDRRLYTPPPPPPPKLIIKGGA